MAVEWTMSIPEALEKVKKSLGERHPGESRLSDAELRALIEDIAADGPLSDEVIVEASERAIEVAGEMREGSRTAE